MAADTSIAFRLRVGPLDIGIKVARSYNRAVRGRSSIGRAPLLQGGGRRFEPGYLHNELD